MKIKGGFQSIDLSTADLTASTLRVGGLSNACAHANNKPVRVKMPDGVEYYGSLREKSGGFEISWLGADSKIVIMQVDDTDDTFTMTFNESGAEVDERLDDIESGLEKVKPQYSVLATGDKRVILTDYDSNTPFTTPSDGIVRIITKAAESSGVSDVRIKGLDNTTPGDFIAMQIQSNGTDQFFGLYVKKGCQIFGTNVENTSIIDFNPFVS